MLKTGSPPTTNGQKGPPRGSPRNLLSTRRGTLAVAIGIAILGGGAILAFLQQYRDSVDAETRPISVLVAKEPIGKGTAGELVANDGLFQVTEVVESEAKDGAITDPATLRGRVAANDIFPGEQLTSADFVTGSRSIESQLTENDRAIAIPVDNAHGLLGQVQAGDQIDVLAGFVLDRGDGRPRPVVRTLVQDVLVLKADSRSGSSRGSSGARSQVVVRVDDRYAAAIAFAADNGKLWVTLRPPSRARQSRPAIVTADAILAGVPPLTLDRNGGRR